MSNDDDFAAMLAEEGKVKPLKLHIGERVQAKVIHIAKDSVFFELSRAQEAVMPRIALVDEEGQLTVKVGQQIEAFVVDLQNGVTLTKKLGKDHLDVGMLEEAQASGMPIDGQVTGVNKGGLEVTVGQVRAFCPMKSIELGYVETPEQYVGKTLTFLVREVRENGRNVVLDRRALLEVERGAAADKLLTTLAVGQRLRGKVTRLQPFGAFVDLGGVDGLIPASELSFARVKVEDVLKVGDEVEVDVLKIEPDPKGGKRPRIALSFKATQPDPLDSHRTEMHEGARLTGKVMRLEKFGAFVELFPGVEGLVHVSEMSDKRIRHPADVVEVGQEVNVRVLTVDADKRRIALSLKEARAEPGSAGGPRVGLHVTGKVERLEKFGVFVALDGGLGSALLPAAETGTPPGTDLSRLFASGTQVEALIIAIDERGRIKISKKALEQNEERAVVAEFNRAQGGGGLGTLGDLLKQRDKKPKR